MRLARLVIQTLPGIVPGFTFEPSSPGVNLVVGPNAIGKSSLTRAIKYLLGSRKDDPPALSLEADFDDGETHWNVIRSGSQIAWRRNGAAASRPALPGADQIGLYRLSVESLLAADDNDDKELAALLRRKLLGDCDLDALRDAVQRPTAAHFGRSEQRTLATAIKNGRAVQNEYSALQKKEATLPDLQRQIEDAQAAASRRGQLEQALTLAGTVQARREQEERFKRFPPEIAELRGDELQRLDELEEKARGLREELRTEQANLESAANELERTGLAQGAPGNEQQQAIDAKLLELSKLETDRNHARAEAAEAKAVKQEALAQLGGGGTTPGFDAEACRRAEELASDWIAGTKRLAELQEQLNVLTDRPTWPLAAAVGAVLASAAAAGLAFHLQATSVAFVAGLAVGLAALSAAWLARGAGIERIRAAVRTCQAEMDQLKLEKDALANEIGFDPTLPAVSFDRFVHQCANWDQANKRYVERTARVADFEQRIADTARGVQEFLDAWPVAGGDGDPAPAAGNGGDANAAADQPDLDLLRSTCKHLSDRVTAADAARSAMSACQKSIETSKRSLGEAEQDTKRCYTGAGVEPGDRAALTARLEQRPHWQAAKEVLDEAVADAKRARDALEDQPELIERAGAGERTQLQAEHDAANDKAAVHTNLIERRQDIRKELELAGGDRRLETAATAEDRARQALEDRREEALLAEATALLLDDVEQDFESEHEPEILRRANEIFEDVTAHEFELHLRPDGTFAARDVSQDEVRTLGQLSSGTRMQLLLALRLAWTEAQEQGGAALPLFLDEALTTSDEARFRVMAQSLERIAGAEDGRQRQIFYLSARRYEAPLWHQATGSEPAVIDLAEVRFGTAEAAPATYRVETSPPIPPPEDGESAEEYASRLGVPRCDPRLPPDGVHVFHLLRDDLPRLHALMDTWRIAALGPLEGLLASDAALAAAGSADACSLLHQRCRTVREWTELWCVGRGRPVDRGVLEQCGAISGTFIDRVAELAERLGGDGAQLPAALRGGQLKRFHTSKTDELEQWLADEGYTDDRERLSADERRRLTLQSVAPETEGDAQDVNQVIDWLESAATWLEPAPGD